LDDRVVNSYLSEGDESDFMHLEELLSNSIPQC
jgi:hypothetical protein